MSAGPSYSERYIRTPRDWPKGRRDGQCLAGSCEASAVEGSPWCARHTYLVGANDAASAIDMGDTIDQAAKRIGEL